MPRETIANGDSIAYEGGAFSPSGDAVVENEYLSVRTPEGWETRDLSPVLADSAEKSGFKAFSGDLFSGVFLQSETPLSPEAPPAGYSDLYGWESITPEPFRPLVTAVPPDRGRGAFRLAYAGASSDFSHLLFEANDALTPATPFAPAAQDSGEKKNNLYEAADGQSRLVNVLPGNATADAAAVFGSGTDIEPGGDPDFSHVISADGSKIFWTDEVTGHLYVRESGETTTEIPAPGEFLTASSDGSEVLLSDGDTYDLLTKATTDLTGGAGGFQGILGASEDLSSVYFVDTAVLTGTETNAQGASAQSGQDNLYLARAGADTFVATLANSDGSGFSTNSGISVGDWTASPSDRTARATANGAYLAFMSTAPLTGYDNTGASCIKNGHVYDRGACAEVFLYDSASARLICASCNPTGAPPAGRLLATPACSPRLRVSAGAPISDRKRPHPLRQPGHPLAVRQQRARRRCL